MFINSMRVSFGAAVTMYGNTKKAEASFCSGGAPSATAKASCPFAEIVGIGVAVGRGDGVFVGGRVAVVVNVRVAERVAVTVRDGVVLAVGGRVELAVAVLDAVRVGGAVEARVAVAVLVVVGTGNGERRQLCKALFSALITFAQSTAADWAAAGALAPSSNPASAAPIESVLTAVMPRIARLME